MLTFVGKALKELYKKSPEYQKGVRKWIDNPDQGDKYRLYLYLSLTEQIAFIYNDNLNFLSCKKLLKSFESDLIPMIFGALTPHFTDCSESLEISDLAYRQSQLSLGSPQAFQQQAV